MLSPRSCGACFLTRPASHLCRPGWATCEAHLCLTQASPPQAQFPVRALPPHSPIPRPALPRSAARTIRPSCTTRHDLRRQGRSRNHPRKLPARRYFRVWRSPSRGIAPAQQDCHTLVGHCSRLHSQCGVPCVRQPREPHRMDRLSDDGLAKYCTMQWRQRRVYADKRNVLCCMALYAACIHHAFLALETLTLVQVHALDHVPAGDNVVSVHNHAVAPTASPSFVPVRCTIPGPASR